MLKFGLIGDPVAHSLSPVMHARFFDYYHIDASYRSIHLKTSELKIFLENIRNSDYLGINVTIPHKENVIPHLDALSNEAKKFGAVNTIHNKNGFLVGYNTDISGFKSSLPISIVGENVILLGAGGSARSIMAACISAGCRQISIFNRTLEKATKLCESFSRSNPYVIFKAFSLSDPELKHELSNARLLVNATSIGMKSNSDINLPVCRDDFHKGLFIYDIIYNPLETELIKIAHNEGIPCLNGLDMLIYQGLESLRIWLNRELPFQKSLIKQTKTELTNKLVHIYNVVK